MAGQTTHFASPERDPIEAIRVSSEQLLKNELIDAILSALPDFALVLNGKRQVLYANAAVLKTFGLDEGDGAIGMRPGEIIGCVHAGETESGCGTSRACRVCDAVGAILEAQKTRASAVREARIVSRGSDQYKAFDLRVSAKPLFLGASEYVIVIMADITDTKMRQIVERIFFHDVLNPLYGLIGSAEILKKELGDNKFVEAIRVSAQTILEEIQRQKELIRLESGEIESKVSLVSSSRLIEQTVAIHRFGDFSENKELRIDGIAPDVEFETDEVLLKRVLGNMLKNALEASKSGDFVRIHSRVDSGVIAFSVTNRQPIEEENQLRIFQRSFSTKGKGRGIGTYSMKLITEKYLKGTIVFASDPVRGTTFTVAIPLNPRSR